MNEAKLKRLEKILNEPSDDPAHAFARAIRLAQSMKGGKLGQNWGYGEKRFGGIWRLWHADRYRKTVAAIGGLARAKALSPEYKHAIASMGGYNRASYLDPKRRKEIARAAAKARW